MKGVRCPWGVGLFIILFVLWGAETLTSSSYEGRAMSMVIVMACLGHQNKREPCISTDRGGVEAGARNQEARAGGEGGNATGSREHLGIIRKRLI